MLLRGFSLGYGLVGIIVFELVEGEGDPVGEADGFGDGVGRFVKKLRHFVRRFQMPFGIGFEKPARLVQGDMLADAGDDVLQFAPFGSSDRAHHWWPAAAHRRRAPRAAIPAGGGGHRPYAAWRPQAKPCRVRRRAAFPKETGFPRSSLAEHWHVFHPAVRPPPHLPRQGFCSRNFWGFHPPSPSGRDGAPSPPAAGPPAI